MHRITINGTTVICSHGEVMKLHAISRKFTGGHLEDIAQTEEGPTEEIKFSELNTPADTREEMNVSYWGAEGALPNNEADREALSKYGCYFNVLVFLDGCENFYRSTQEEERND